MNIVHSSGAPLLPPSGWTSQSDHKGLGVQSPKRILIVDDDVVFLRAMSFKLRAFGYEALTAVDGAAAVSTIRQLRPDLILLDLNFPPDVAHGGGVCWDGFLILNWLRRMDEAQHIPVIAVTAGDQAGYKERCLAAGVLDFFLKPVDHEVLLWTIRSALNQETPEHKPTPKAKNCRKILFVDDESDWRYMGTLYLTECGYEVFTSEDAAGALQMAAAERPDVIVLDLNLGDESGLTLMKLLAVAHPQVPILIYTGMELDDEAVLNLHHEGAYECLRKGTMEELLNAVGAAIEAIHTEKEGAPKEIDELSEGTNESGIESVLVVEDDVAFGDVIRTFLESHPFCVTRVTDGAEALRHILAVDFDLILCDMVLPTLPGDQLYRSVQGVKPHLCSRFVFMTGHQADPKSDEFIRRVRGLMLWKPFHLADLLAAAQIIRRKNSSKSLAMDC